MNESQQTFYTHIINVGLFISAKQNGNRSICNIVKKKHKHRNENDSFL